MYRTGRDSFEVIEASEGIEQGDSAGPALFAAGVRDPLDRLRAELAAALRARGLGTQARAPTDDAGFVFAYLDDTFIGVPPELAGQALELAARIFSEEGYTLNVGKCGCWSPQTPVGSLPASCTQGTMWRAEGLVVAGIPVYSADRPDSPLVTEKLEKVLDKSRRENALLLELCADAAEGWSRIQSAFLILRLSLATKFIFYAQTVDPTLALPFARQFDQVIVDSFSKLVDSAPNEFDENAIRQMQLPVKEGGFGFHSHSIMDLHKFYVASALLACPTVEAATGFRVGENFYCDNL